MKKLLWSEFFFSLDLSGIIPIQTSPRNHKKLKLLNSKKAVLEKKLNSCVWSCFAKNNGLVPGYSQLGTHSPTNSLLPSNVAGITYSCRSRTGLPYKHINIGRLRDVFKTFFESYGCLRNVFKASCVQAIVRGEISFRYNYPRI